MPRMELRVGEGEGGLMDDVSIEEASVELGMSPTAVIALLENGRLPSHLGIDGRRRRVLRTDLETHREVRFNVRQRRVQEQRARRWADPDAAVADLPA
jgi:excisionase family DNA binding protein